MGVRAVRVWWLGVAVLVGLLAVVFAGAGLAPAAAAGAGQSPLANGALDAPAVQDGNWTVDPPLSEYDEVVTEFVVDDNGSASVTVDYRYRLDGGNRSADWEALRAAVEDDPDRYLEWFTDRRTEMHVTGEKEADREMEVSGFDVTAEELTGGPAYGQVRFTYRWSAFAYVDVNRIVAGDALPEFVMDERTQLVISWPDGYANTSIEPEPDDHRETAAIWFGEDTREFVDGEPRVAVMTGADGADDDAGGDGLPIALLAGAGAVVVAFVVGGWWAASREDATDPDPAPMTPEATDATPAADPPAELLSNEERVLGLLEKRGGRVKQQAVVSELDWTEAKTSQVVGGLREAGEIDVFRIGRENVLALPEETPNGNGADVPSEPADGDER